MDEIDFLKKLDLTGYESRVYLALAKLGTATARSVVEYSKIPKNKTYETLHRLLEKKLVQELPITPKQYKINEIGQLQEIIDSKKKEAEQLQNSFDSFSKIINQTQTEYQDIFSIIKGQKAIQEKLNHLDKHAEKEILTINKLSKFLPKNLRSVKKKIDLGVKVKMICLLDSDNESIVKEWQKIGVEIRLFNTELFGKIIPKFTIYDEKVLRITIGKPEIQESENYLSFIIESKPLIQVFQQQFSNMWEKSQKL